MNGTRRIKAAELSPHIPDIQRQAIEFYKLPNFFASERRFERWKSCVQMVAKVWMDLGPQGFGNGQGVILLGWTGE